MHYPDCQQALKYIRVLNYLLSIWSEEYWRKLGKIKSIPSASWREFAEVSPETKQKCGLETI